MSKKQPTTVRTAVSDEFALLCSKHGVSATKRQESKFRNNYGALARAMGTSDRRVPPGK